MKKCPSLKCKTRYLGIPNVCVYKGNRPSASLKTPKFSTAENSCYEAFQSTFPDEKTFRNRVQTEAICSKQTNPGNPLGFVKRGAWVYQPISPPRRRNLHLSSRSGFKLAKLFGRQRRPRKSGILGSQISILQREFDHIGISNSENLLPPKAAEKTLF